MPKVAAAAGMLLGYACLYTPPTAAQERQLPADQRAFQAAMAQADPAQRLRAFRTFSVEFQDSKYFDRVQESALQLLLRYFPSHLGEIRDQVQVNVANADKGYDRLVEQAREADQLADAGVLLPFAQRLGEEAVHGLTEAVYLRGMARLFGTLQLEVPTPTELHSGFVDRRATVVLSLAHVLVRQDKVAAAAPLLQEAAALDPRNAELYALRGEQALAAKDDAVALNAFETAAVLGELPPADRAAMQQLFRATHPGAPDAALQDSLDRSWSEQNPAPFERGPHTGAAPAAHTVLLELFTGAGCLPCVGADAAAEALFDSYGARDVVLLEWDEHVPQPDPLANPASVARAEVFSVGNTPTFLLDGKRMAVLGGSSAEAPGIYSALSRLVDEQAARASGITLRLSVTRDAANQVQANATVQSAPAEALHSTSVAEFAPWPGDSLAVAAQAHDHADEPVVPVINFVLVEDHVRYSGENGVRFHRMVARALQSAAGYGDPLHTGTTEEIRATFHPSEIQKSLEQYLAGFQSGNDRFGPVQLLSTEVSLRPTELGIVAFVQDTQTHRVLQAAYAPVPPPADRTP